MRELGSGCDERRACGRACPATPATPPLDLTGSLVRPVRRLWNADSRDSGESLPMHVAVCLAEEGDCVQLYEVSSTTWPCPHDSYESCKVCLEQRKPP